MNFPTPKVSVIIPVYNTEKYLPACLDSVLNQTRQDFEIIAVDDCSPDRCGAILDEYAARDKRIKVVHLPENRRQGHARNCGLEVATGEYLYFFDSDDLIEPETFEELTRLADRDALDAIFFDKKALFDDDELRNVYMPPFCARKAQYRDAVVTGDELMTEFFRAHEWTCYPQQIFWRRKFIQDAEIRYLEGSEHEDEFFAYAGVLLAQRVRYIRKDYITLRIRPNSVMTSPKSARNLHGYLMNFYHMTEFCEKHGIKTYASETNLTVMMDCAINIYERLKDSCDLSEPFQKELDKTVYRYFMSYIRLEYGETGFYAMDADVLKEVRKYKSAYVYGVGDIPRRVCRQLERHGVVVAGFLTPDPERAPAVFLGRTVQDVNKADVPDDAIVVTTESSPWEELNWDDAREILTKRNIHCIFHQTL